jgi:hypothetical protein
LPDAAFVTGCCTSFRKSLIPLILPVPTEAFVHDTWIHALSERLHIRRLLPDVLQDFRRHERNTSRWLASSTTRIGALDRVQAYKNENSRLWCEKRIVRLNLLAQRIKQVGPEVLEALGLGERIPKALLSIEVEKIAASARLRVLQMPRWKRWLPAVILFLKGHYKPFSGWKSFAKDVIRG